jgi:uncharacterized protein YbjT (DUF2867 family)
MSKYVVLGGRGGTGLEVARRLVEKSAADVAEVVAVVRDPTKVPEGKMPSDPRVKLVAGDVTQADTLRAAFTGANAIFYAASGTNHEQCVAVDWKAVGTCAVVAKEVTSARIVLISSQLVHPRNKLNPIRGLLNTMTTGLFHRKGYMDFKYAGEHLLRSSGNDYCIIRPGELSDGPLGEAQLHIGQTNGMFNKGGRGNVSRADIAAIMVAAALAPGARNTTFEVTAVGGSPATVINDELFKDLDAEWDTNWVPGLATST